MLSAVAQTWCTAREQRSKSDARHSSMPGKNRHVRSDMMSCSHDGTSLPCSCWVTHQTTAPWPVEYNGSSSIGSSSADSQQARHSSPLCQTPAQTTCVIHIQAMSCNYDSTGSLCQGDSALWPLTGLPTTQRRSTRPTADMGFLLTSS